MCATFGTVDFARSKDTFCQTEKFTMTELFSSVMSLVDVDVGAYYNPLKQ